MRTGEPDFLRVRRLAILGLRLAISWALAAAGVLRQELDASFVECERVTEAADMRHAIGRSRKCLVPD